MTVGRVEILGGIGLLGCLFETIAADRLGDRAGFLGRCAGRETYRERAKTHRSKNLFHGCPPIAFVAFAGQKPTTEYSSRETRAISMTGCKTFCSRLSTHKRNHCPVVCHAESAIIVRQLKYSALRG